jgi:hypothetical protein
VKKIVMNWDKLEELALVVGVRLDGKQSVGKEFFEL